jgi:hypothetical protein
MNRPYLRGEKEKESVNNFIIEALTAYTSKA